MKSNLANLIRKRKLVAEIVRFRLKSTAVDNRLGFLYWLVDPILMILVYWFVFSVLRGTDVYSPYPVFLGCAIISWKYFTRCLGNGIKTFKSHGSTMKSIPFPTIVLPIALTLEEGILYIFGVVALVVVAALLGCTPTPYLWQLLPLIAIQAVFMFGIALVASVLGAIIYDLSLYISHAIRIGFYISPSLYGIDMIKDKLISHPEVFEAYILINPFALLFTGYRLCIWDPGPIPIWWYCVLSIHAILFAFLGFQIYQRLDRRLLKSSAL